MTVIPSGHLGRRVLVTGGGSGIGLAAAHALTERGFEVAIADRDFSRVGSDLSAVRVTVDVCREPDVEQMFADVASAVGPLDVVIHCAGIMREQGRDIREVSLESWNELLAVNLTGAFLVARAAIRMMAPRGRGVLIIVGSGGGTYSPSGSIPYGASKGGVNGLVVSLEGQLTGTGIRVHNFCPGSVDTPLIQGSLDEALANGRSRSAVASTRSALADAAGVGKLLAFLATEDADALKGNICTT